MREPNPLGVYDAETTEELVRRGRAYAAISLCQCEDGLYRYSLALLYSYGGFCGPISNLTDGFPTLSSAKEAATQELLRRFPAPWAGDPQSVHDELRDMRAVIEGGFRQLSLF